MNHRTTAMTCVVALLAATAWAQNTRDAQVREDRAKLAEREEWIYNDLDQAMAEAKAAKKPLLIVFR